MRLRCKFLFLVFMVFGFSAPVFAAVFKDCRLLKISASDQRAVIQQPDGKLRVIAPGDELDGARVSEIAEGRVVLIGKGGEMVIVRFEHGRQRIESYQKLGEQPPPMTAPADGDAGKGASMGSGAGYQ